jgi:hypothetical protein
MGHCTKGPLVGRSQAYLNEELWLEHLEDENDPTFEEDLELLLGNSPADRRLLDGLKSTRQLIKSADEVSLPESGHYYDQFHDRIMAAIDEEIRENGGIQASPSATNSKKSMRTLRLAWPAIISTMTLTVVLSAVTWFALKTGMGAGAVSHLVKVAANGSATDESAGEIDRKLAEMSTAETVSGTMVAFQSETDFVTDAAIDRLNNLDKDQVDKLFDHLKQ